MASQKTRRTHQQLGSFYNFWRHLRQLEASACTPNISGPITIKSRTLSRGKKKGPVLSAWKLERKDFSEVLLATLDRGWTRRALLWDGMDHEDQASALQLGLRRHPEGPQGLRFPLRPGIVCCELGPEPRVVPLGVAVQRFENAGARPIG